MITPRSQDDPAEGTINLDGSLSRIHIPPLRSRSTPNAVSKTFCTLCRRERHQSMVAAATTITAKSSIMSDSIDCLAGLGYREFTRRQEELASVFQSPMKRRKSLSTTFLHLQAALYPRCRMSFFAAHSANLGRSRLHFALAVASPFR